ncbi:MAG: DUF1624 domain-containing protein [Aureisphaera sp.]
MNTVASHRIQSIDILRGVVMVLMALDHVRDFYHLGGMTSDPANMDTTTPLLFFTRFITHFCAPVFIFLAGTSAYLYGQKRTKKELSYFLWTRGLWLIIIEITINTFLWWFDPSFGFINLQVLWAIGICMILLAGLIHLPKKAIIVFGLLLVFGHNALDSITSENSGLGVFWAFLHELSFTSLGSRWVSISYPIIPWVGVMSLGYVFGELYKKGSNPKFRQKWLMGLGLTSIALFFVLRGLNIYGDLVPWSIQKNTTYTILSFFNVAKYPPSLAFLLITLGPAFLFLKGIEKVQNRISNFFIVFGRVPFFYYLLHMLVLHLAALLALVAMGKDWTLMVFTQENFTNPDLANYGYSLGVVYLVWIGVVIICYPICKKYMKYKADNKHKKWLSYL